MKIGIIVAMKKELNLLRIGLENKKEFSCEGWDVCSGTFSGKEIWIIQCGIGKVNAALCTEMLVRNFKPDLVINSGVAGGADACMGVGHVLVPMPWHIMMYGAVRKRNGVPLQAATR